MTSTTRNLYEIQGILNSILFKYHVMV